MRYCDIYHYIHVILITLFNIVIICVNKHTRTIPTKKYTIGIFILTLQK